MRNKAVADKQRNLEGGLVMMKKVLALMLVLGMTSFVNASVIDIVPVGVGDLGHAGTSSDPLEAGETIMLKMVLNWVPGSFPAGTYPSYDGYLLSAMDLSLTFGSGGTLDVVKNAKGVPQWGEHADWTFTGGPTIVGNVLTTGPYASNADNIGVTNGLLAGGSNQDILWNFYWTCDGTGGIVPITWGLATVPGQYADYTGDGIVPDPEWKDITLSDLGGITIIHQVPEPMTIALLGLGGLFLRKRR